MSRLIGLLIGPMGLIRPMGPMGLIGLMGLMGCSSDSGEPMAEPAPTGVAITFRGLQGEEQAQQQGARAYRAYRANEAYEPNEAQEPNELQAPTKPSRRAGTPLNEQATSFNVWGYKALSYDEGTGVYGNSQQVFPGYEVDYINNSASTTTTNSSGWEYILASDPEQTIKYWDWSAKAYRFFAVTGYNGANGANGTYGPNAAYATYKYSIAADCGGADEDEIADNIAATPYYSKQWFSTGNLITYPDKQFGNPVQLEFMKPFARVRYIFKYVYPREGIVIDNVAFKPTDGSKIARKGTVTVVYPLYGTETREWFEVTPDGGDTGALTAFTEDYDPEDDTKVFSADCPGGWYTVLPNLSQGSYTLSAKVNNADRQATVPAEYMHWLPGYSYTYIFKITEEGGIEIGWVEYAMTPWTEQPADWTVYNW